MTPSRAPVAKPPSLRSLQQAAGGVRPAREPGLPAIRRKVLWSAVWIGLIVLLGFWWHQTPGSATLGAPALLTTGGRLAGLIGGYLLLIQVLLMSRVPVIDRALSGARKSSWHRSLGAYVIGMITLHIVLITLGYAATAKVGIWHEAWTLLTTYQDTISALVAFSIMVILAVTAIRQIRTRLPYGLWHALHSCTYLILLFVYGHQFADGQQFVLSHAARVYWASLYLLVIAAVVWGRVLEPLRLNLRHRLRVAQVVSETPGVTSIYLTGTRLAKFPAIAGQYVRWRFLAPGDWWRSHPFSLSAAPNGAYLRVTVKATGDFSGRLHDLTPGTRVLAEAPTGEFTADHRVRAGALLIAAGSGITPVRAILETLPSGAIVLIRARTSEDLIFKDEIDKLAAARRAHVTWIIGRRDEPEPTELLTPTALRKRVPDIAARDIYLCGPAGFTAQLQRALIELRVPAAQVHLDGFEL
ncbi:MAG TPA: ferric reductase-like transmembrane domain-containing protein [Micromonosporaceae bacterium]